MNKNLLWIIVSVMIVASCQDKKKAERSPVLVKTMTASVLSMTAEQTYSGTTVAQKETPLSFAEPGTIKSLNFKQGQMVKAGQVLGTIDPTRHAGGVGASQAGIDNAKAQLAEAQDMYNRMKMMHDENALSEQKWVMAQEELKRAQAGVKNAEAQNKVYKKGLSDTRLIAPYSGYISKKLAEVGENTTAGFPVAQIVQIDRMKVKISVPEDDINKIKKGGKVYVRVPALGERMYHGVISEKSVTADGLSHSYEVRIDIQDTDRELLPGMICDVALSDASGQEVVLLPAELIQLDYKNRSFVWTVKGGKAERTEVQTGKNVGDKIEVLHGLPAGTKVITEGQQKVSTGMAVKETNK